MDSLLNSQLSSNLLTANINHEINQEIHQLLGELLAENQALKQQLKTTELAYQMAKEMSSFKGAFLARISHELRSPLNGLIGLHQLILADLCESPQEEREFIKQANERSLKLIKLIDEILMISKIEHGTTELNITSLKLLDIFEEVYHATYLLAANRNYPFNVTFPDPEVYILADHRYIRQILINLIEMNITINQESNIHLSSSGINTNNHNINDHHYVSIWLDIPKDSLLISEAIDLIKSETQPEPIENLINCENSILSLGMKFLVNQILIEMMEGKLVIIESPIMKQVKPEIIRLEISIPYSVQQNSYS